MGCDGRPRLLVHQCPIGVHVTTSPAGPAPRRFTINVLLLVALGGAVGALARYGVDTLNPAASSTGDFPYGTLVANVSGAFGLGLLLAVLDRVHSSWIVKPLIATGFFGAYTTFSTFAVEVATRVKDEYHAVAALYVAATILVGLALAKLGHLFGRHVGAHRATSP